MGRLRSIRGRTPVYTAPKTSAELETELLYGQFFCPVRSINGFVEGQLVPLIDADHMPLSMGFVREKDLVSSSQTASHKVSALQASIFSKDHIKSQIKGRLPFGARLTILSQKSEFYKIGRGQYVHSRHVAEIDDYVDDFVAAAEQHLGLPYIWGGVSSDGLDCSGLVQSALWAAGQACPRNSGDQKDHLGQALDLDAPLQRGDLVFWPGHVGIMQDADRLLHANGFHMSTYSEPLNAAAQRIEKSTGPIIAVKRLER